MTSSGTYAFDPSLGDLTLYCFNLAGIRAIEIQQEHLTYAKIAANKVCLDWSNRGVNLWKVDFVENVPLVDAQAVYDVDQSTIVMLDTYVRIDDGISPAVDRIMTPISRSEYATYPNKTQEGFPTVYWYNRQISPNVTLWQVPNGSSPNYLCYYRLVQIEDSALAGGVTQDMPARWLPAFIDAYAVELARAWNPAMISALQPFAKDSYAIAANQDVETSNVYISPQMSQYWRTR